MVNLLTHTLKNNHLVSQVKGQPCDARDLLAEDCKVLKCIKYLFISCNSGAIASVGVVLSVPVISVTRARLCVALVSQENTTGAATKLVYGKENEQWLCTFFSAV